MLCRSTANTLSFTSLGSGSDRGSLAEANFAIVRHARRPDYIILQIDRYLAFLQERRQQRNDIARIHEARVGRHSARKVDGSLDEHAIMDNVLARFSQLAVAAGFSRTIDDYRARLHCLDHVAGNENGRAAAGYLRRRNDDVGIADQLAQMFVLLAFGFLGDFLRVAALPFSFRDVKPDERCAQALDLFFGRSADVERLDDGAQTAGGRDRHQAGDAGTDDEHFGWWNRPRRSHQHRKKTTT